MERASTGRGSAAPRRGAEYFSGQKVTETPVAAAGSPAPESSPSRTDFSKGAAQYMNNKSSRFPGKLGLVAAVVAILLAAGLAYWFLRPQPGLGIDSSKYQAVFFTNGQVYFGKLAEMPRGYYKLTNIFYLQPKEQTADAKNPQATATAGSSELQLIKLGSEIHGPEDTMILSKDQLLFFENLKKDGKVSQSIASYKP